MQPKKFAAMALAVSAVFVLTACGGDDDDSSSGTSSSSTSSASSSAASSSSSSSSSAASSSASSAITRPQLTDTQAASSTLLKTLAAAGSADAPTTDNWDPVTNGIGDVSSFTATYTVAATGGTHTTVQDAVNAAVTAGGTSRVYIRVMPGTYREQVCIKSAPPITLYSTDADASKVVIVNNHYNGEAKTTGVALNACEGRSSNNTYGTSGSTTFLVYSDGFQAKNVTFSNDFDESTASSGLQAVAVTTTGDKLIFDNVRFLGNQDTLQTKSSSTGVIARSYFANSYVEGDTDFVFGRGVSVFNNVTFKSLTSRTTQGYVFAPSHPQIFQYGYLAINSTFTSDTTAAADTMDLNLGRAWDDSSGGYTSNGVTYVPNGIVIVRESTLGAHIRKSTAWGAAATTNRPFNATESQTVTWSSVTTVFPANRLYEYKNTGAGAAD
ncbi:MAG: pectinesterase family protein [Rhodocyclaceae bacterium]